MPLRRIAGAAPVQSSAGGPSQPLYGNFGDGGSNKVLHNINLDAGELFGQFCAYANLVRLGPRRGVFLSTVPIVNPGNGVMRVWREWLRDRAKQAVKEGNEVEEDAALARSSTTLRANIGQDEHVMWTDYHRNVGLRTAVYDKKGNSHGDDTDLDDVSLSFSVEIKGRFLPLVLLLGCQAFTACPLAFCGLESFATAIDNSPARLWCFNDSDITQSLLSERLISSSPSKSRCRIGGAKVKPSSSATLPP